MYGSYWLDWSLFYHFTIVTLLASCSNSRSWKHWSNLTFFKCHMLWSLCLVLCSLSTRLWIRGAAHWKSALPDKATPPLLPVKNIKVHLEILFIYFLVIMRIGWSLLYLFHLKRIWHYDSYWKYLLKLQGTRMHCCSWKQFFSYWSRSQ